MPTVALRKPSSRRLARRLLFLVFSVALAVWSISPLWQRIDQQRELNLLRRQMAIAKTDESRLRREIDQLRTNNEYIEMMVRKNLGMIKPDEESYAVIEQKDSKK